MYQYLTEEQLQTSLRLGRSIEQWLGYEHGSDYTILKWLRIDKEKNNEYSVSYFESFDEGSEQLLDIYEFSLLDADEPFGVISTLASVDEALKFATETYNAYSNKYVSAGMIQKEYSDYLDRKNIDRQRALE